MPSPSQLLLRLEQIAQALEEEPHALALIGLGSTGTELFRLDEYSDLDFFLVVQAGQQATYIQNLGWLERAHPISWNFQNTVDGHKLLFSDGIFAEMAVFSLDQLTSIPYANARLIWHRPAIHPELIPVDNLIQNRHAHSKEWLIGEILSNLYVGLCRDARGEKLSAQRFIQHYAVDHLIKLLPWLAPQAQAGDPFANERRLESRFPEFADCWSKMVQGVQHNRQSAAQILVFMENHFEIQSDILHIIKNLSSA